MKEFANKISKIQGSAAGCEIDSTESAPKISEQEDLHQGQPTDLAPFECDLIWNLRNPKIKEMIIRKKTEGLVSINLTDSPPSDTSFRDLLYSDADQDIRAIVRNHRVVRFERTITKKV
jgi:hypothetical protein